MEEVGAVVNSTVVLHCDVTGHPTPSISWLRDGKQVHADLQHHISKNGAQLQVSLCRKFNILLLHINKSCGSALCSPNKIYYLIITRKDVIIWR